MSYDATRDPVLLATWAEVREADAVAWLAGDPVAVASALEAARAEIANWVTSPEFDEIREEVRRYQRLPVSRRWAVMDELTRADQRVREAWLGVE